MNLLFKKSIKLKVIKGSKSRVASYNFCIYEGEDQLIELCDINDANVIFRLELTSRKVVRIMLDNDLNTSSTQIVDYIQTFLEEISESKWLECTMATDSCQVRFIETSKLADRCSLCLTLDALVGEALTQYLASQLLMHKRLLQAKEMENEQLKKLTESREKKMREELQEAMKSKKSYEDELENFKCAYNETELDNNKVKEEKYQLWKTVKEKDDVIYQLQNEINCLRTELKQKAPDGMKDSQKKRQPPNDDDEKRRGCR